MQTSLRSPLLPTHFRFAMLAAMLSLCATHTAAQTQTQAPPGLSATVTFVSGDATILSAQGARRPALNGQALSSGDTVETGKGRVQLRMVDGGLMSLQQDTTLRLDDYHLAKDGGTDEKGYMSLVKGGLRTVSGFIGKARPDNYRLQTPVGMIGIRGTEYTATLREGLTVAVVGGRVAVCNATGCQDVSRGESAFTAAASARPVVSKLVTTVVPAATVGAATATATTTAAVETNAANTPTPVLRTSGEDVRSYLQTLLVATAVDPDVTTTGEGNPAGPSTTAQAAGTFSPPPATARPAPSPSPTPGVDVGTSAPGLVPLPGTPAPGEPPSPGATPTVEHPLSPSQGNVVMVSTNKKGDTAGSATLGYRTYADAALTELRDKDDSGKKYLEKPSLAETHSDGIVAWGRWTDGKRNIDDNAKGDVNALHYFTFAGSPTLPILKSFSAFGSTATTVISSTGVLGAVGAENAAGGSLQVTFPSIAGGYATYNLTVPIAGQTFSLAGTALQTGTYGFAGPALINSTGNGCTNGCAGALGAGNAVRGMVGGTGSSRAGLVYGFTSNMGQVTGAMVFKP